MPEPKAKPKIKRKFEAQGFSTPGLQLELRPQPKKKDAPGLTITQEIVGRLIERLKNI